MRKSKKTLSWATKTIDTSTGEVVEQVKTVTVETDSADFYLTFIDAIGYLIGVSNSTELQILSLLCINAEFDKGICMLPSSRRREFCDILEITPNSFGVYLSRLSKKGLIKNISGVVEINPICFWKGSVKERNKLLRDNMLELNIKFKSQE